MLSNKEIFEYGMSIFCGKKVRICVIDFIRLQTHLSLGMKKKHGDFRDELVRRFPLNSEDCSKKKNLQCKWTLEIISSDIIDDVIQFNENLKSIPESHQMIFICLDNQISSDQQALLHRSYFNSKFFQFDQISLNINLEKIFKYLQEKKFFQKKCLNFYPLLLHMNSISTGLVFNYYFSYLNRQISTTNNIFLIFTFNININSQLFPSTISIILNTFIENIFLKDSFSINNYDYLEQIQSNILQFNYDSTATTYQSINQKQTIVTYSLCGTYDFGSIIQQIRIWHNLLHINFLISIQLKDYVRQWNQYYQPCSSFNRDNNDTNIIFENREDPMKKCYLYEISDIPNIINGHPGISTMKKTTKDCYDMYINDSKNHFTENGEKISQILISPYYYIILPSSCQFEPLNINQYDQTIIKGTIIDPHQTHQIRLAYANNEVLRSNAMYHYNRYLRRTFYYIDKIDSNKQIIRYLFSAEYPFILSILNQISNIDKRDEYLRFCNILYRLIQIDNLCSSVKLIEFNDQTNFDADFKTLSTQITEHIQQFYQISINNQIDISFINTQILDIKQTNHILLFFTNNAKHDQSILTLINNLNEKLLENGYIVEDAQQNINLINTNKQIIFIFLGKKDKKMNRLIINAIQQKINHFGVLRDVFILINDAIQHFPCRFLRSIPHLTFNLQKRSPHLNNQDIQNLNHYLNNMNVLSKSYKDNFEDINQYLNKSIIQCTNIGEGCATAFYFNYIKLLISLPEHKSRIDLINNQLKKDNLINNQSKFISKWIFIIPTKIKNINEIISYALNINQDEQNKIQFKLSLWQSKDSNFINPDIKLTIGGILDRCYSALKIYKLTNSEKDEIIYFPMEIPAALNSLENQYKNMISHFNFGYFDPLKQGFIFRNKLEEYYINDNNEIIHSNVIFISIDNSQKINLINTEIFLKTLWDKIY